jgi:hypothetical protein
MHDSRHTAQWHVSVTATIIEQTAPLLALAEAGRG